MPLVIDADEAQELVAQTLRTALTPFRNASYTKDIEGKIVQKLNSVISELTPDIPSMFDLQGNIAWVCERNEEHTLVAHYEPMSKELRGKWVGSMQTSTMDDPNDPEYLLYTHLYGAQSTEHPNVMGWGPTPLHAVAEMNSLWERDHG